MLISLWGILSAEELLCWSEVWILHNIMVAILAGFQISQITNEEKNSQGNKKPKQTKNPTHGNQNLTASC